MKTAVGCKDTAWIGGGLSPRSGVTKGVRGVLAEALAAELIANGLYDGKDATLKDAVNITSGSSDGSKPRSNVCGAGSPGIAKNQSTLCLSVFFVECADNRTGECCLAASGSLRQSNEQRDPSYICAYVLFTLLRRRNRRHRRRHLIGRLLL